MSVTDCLQHFFIDPCADILRGKLKINNAFYKLLMYDSDTPSQLNKEAIN
jgi:hypothetical protein